MDRDLIGGAFLLTLILLAVLSDLLPPGCWLARALDSFTCSGGEEEEDGAGDVAGPGG